MVTRARRRTIARTPVESVRYIIPAGARREWLVNAPQNDFSKAIPAQLVPFIQAMCTRLQLQCTVHRTSLAITMPGILNTEAMTRKWQARTLLRNITLQAERYERAIADQRAQRARYDRTPLSAKPSRLDAATIARFIDSFGAWSEVMEVAHPGGVLDRVPPRVNLGPLHTVGVRFWPVIFSKRENGRSVWFLVPPMGFTVGGPQGINGSHPAHPHVYNDGHLCNGNAHFEYGNLIQCLPMLRDWHQGHQPGDQATQTWRQVAHQWWTTHKADCFRAVGDEAKVILAPWQYRAKTRVVPLTEEMVTAFLQAGGEWITDEAPLRAPAVQRITPATLEASGTYGHNWRTVDDGTCTVCAMPAQFEVDYTTTQSFALCACHACTLPSWPSLPHDTEPTIDLDPTFAVRLQQHTERDHNCAFVLCGDPNCMEHEVPESRGEIATWRITVPGHRTYYVCDGHASAMYSRMRNRMPLVVHQDVSPPVIEYVTVEGEVPAGVAVVEDTAPAPTAIAYPITLDPDHPRTIVNGIDATFMVPRMRMMLQDPRLNLPLLQRKFGTNLDGEYCTQCGLTPSDHELHECKFTTTGRLRRYTLPPFPEGYVAPVMPRVAYDRDTPVEVLFDGRTDWFVRTAAERGTAYELWRKFGPAANDTSICTDCGRSWTTGHAGETCNRPDVLEGHTPYVGEWVTAHTARIFPYYGEDERVNIGGAAFRGRAVAQDMFRMFGSIAIGLETQCTLCTERAGSHRYYDYIGVSCPDGDIAPPTREYLVAAGTHPPVDDYEGR